MSAAFQCAQSRFTDLTTAAIDEAIRVKLGQTPTVVVDGKVKFGGANVTYANILAAICKVDASIAACAHR